MNTTIPNQAGREFRLAHVKAWRTSGRHAQVGERVDGEGSQPFQGGIPKHMEGARKSSGSWDHSQGRATHRFSSASEYRPPDNAPRIDVAPPGLPSYRLGLLEPPDPPRDLGPRGHRHRSQITTRDPLVSSEQPDIAKVRERCLSPGVASGDVFEPKLNRRGDGNGSTCSIVCSAEPFMRALIPPS